MDDYDYFGSSVARADNIKGNTESGLIVGAYNAGSSQQGAAYIFYQSGSTLGSTPTTLTGQSSGDQFGFSVAGGADQDNDGKNDVLIGAPGATNGQTDEGKAYLYRGTSTGINSTAAWTGESNQAYACYGYSVAIGDVDYANGADLLVGAPYFDNTLQSLTNNGRAYSYLTDSGGTPTLTNYIDGQQSSDYNSQCVAHLYKTQSGTETGWLVAAPNTHSGGGTLQGGTVIFWKFVNVP